MMISEIYKKFLVEQKFRNNTKKTIDWYKDNLEEFFEWLGGSDDEKLLTLDNFKLYGAQLRDSVKRNGDKLSDASVQNALRAVKTFYNLHSTFYNLTFNNKLSSIPLVCLCRIQIRRNIKK